MRVRTSAPKRPPHWPIGERPLEHWDGWKNSVSQARRQAPTELQNTLSSVKQGAQIAELAGLVHRWTLFLSAIYNLSSIEHPESKTRASDPRCWRFLYDMKLSRASVSLAFLVALVCAAALGQKPAATDQTRARPPKDDKAQTIGILEVELPITVKNKRGFVDGLRREDFEVYEDGKRQVITKFDAPSKLPLNIAVLMDTSNSVKLKLPFEKDAAEDFIATVTTYRKKDQVLFATFDSSVELHQDFTDAQEPLIRAIRKVKANGYTKLYDGVYRVVEEKMSSPQTPEARRVMVIISDGADTASERSLRDAIQIAQRFNVTVFGISTKNFSGIGAGSVEGSEDKELRQLCEQTGGQVFLPSEKAELFRSFTRIEQDLRREYVVYYTPTNQEKNGKFREIKVKLVKRDGDLYYKRGYVHE